MRIVGGNLRGLGLTPVGRGDAAAHLRPTSDRVRESVFNLIRHGRKGELLEGARVLDLFAGTGAMGLEALSRGAAFVTFVDNGRAAARLLSENIARARARDMTRLLRRDATRIGPADDAPNTLVFVDPPYRKGLGERALAAAAKGGWIAPGALIVWEEGARCEPPEGFSAIDSRRYGTTFVTLLECMG